MLRANYTSPFNKLVFSKFVKRVILFLDVLEIFLIHGG